MMNKHLNYCRVSPIKGEWGQWNSTNYELFVHIVIFTPDWRPNYAIGKHLRIETDKSIYLVYNPQKLTFDFNKLMGNIKTNLALWGEKFEGYEIVDLYRGK